jgi:hypothetical protein
MRHIGKNPGLATPAQFSNWRHNHEGYPPYFSRQPVLTTGATSSFLYFETEGYSSGLLGYLKPVSQAMYGNYLLVEALAKDFTSPLDIDFEELQEWNAKQWDAYCRATLMTLKGYLEKQYGSQCYALNRAFNNIERSFDDLYELNDTPDLHKSDIYNRLSVTTEFVRETIELINKQPNLPRTLLRNRNNTSKDIYDTLALLIYNMCFAASTVNSTPGISWTIHHNLVWNSVFNLNNGDAWKVVRFKVRRLLYDEIARLTEMPNYKGSRILGFCLNVLGMETGQSKQNYGRDAYALAKAVQSWAREHYLSLQQKNPDVADSVLIGSVSFDAAGSRLVKTYMSGPG